MSNRKYFTPEQKVAIVRRHLLEDVPISNLCDEFGIHATQYYTWQKQLFENAASCFERRPNQANERRQQDAYEKKDREARSEAAEEKRGRRRAAAGARPVKKSLGEL